MATITYRKLDANGDPLFGSGQSNFISDLDAVAQAISTRLKLFQGEWWEDLTLGTPIFQSILGAANGKTPQAVALLLQQRILSTPYVTGISNVQAKYNPSTRSFSFACQVQTKFGTLAVTNNPGSNAALS